MNSIIPVFRDILTTRNMYRMIVVPLLVFILSFLVISCSAQPTYNKTTDAYEFPIKPGMEEWRAFRTHDEMLAACQIPESVLKTMSTEGLVETVLNYPLRIDTFAYNDLQTGFDAVASQFNGIPELLSREDAATELLAKYRSLDIVVVNDWGPLEAGEYIIGKVAFTEILMAQDAIISKLNKTERSALLSEAVNISAEKSQLAEAYGTNSQIYTTWIVARVLQHENYAPFMQKVEESDALQLFITNGSVMGVDFVDLLDEIISMAQEFGR